MTSHILDLIHKRQLEVQLAKAKLSTPPVETMQIVYYMHGSDVGHNVRYVDSKLADTQFKAFIKAKKEGKEIILTGSSTTVYIGSASNVAQIILLNLENNIFFITEQQKRMNARMQLA